MRGEAPSKFSKIEGGLTGSEFLEGVAVKEVGVQCYIKNKLKSEIFNNRKSL